MTTPRSAGVNRHTEGHPEDLTNRSTLRVDIIAGLEARRQAGATLAGISREFGHFRDFMTTPYHPDRHPTSTWLWNQTWDLCQGAGLVLTVKFNGLEGTSPVWKMAQLMPQYQGVGAMEFLKDAREVMGMSGNDLARRLGVAKSSVWNSEENSNPRLSTIQRYARALGGKALFTARSPK